MACREKQHTLFLVNGIQYEIKIKKYDETILSFTPENRMKVNKVRTKKKNYLIHKIRLNEIHVSYFVCECRAPFVSIFLSR